MRHCRITHVRIIRQNDVVFFYLAFIGIHEAADERAELANDHLTVAIRHHREAITLLPDPWAHRCTKKNRIHFDAYISQRVFYDIYRNRIDLNSFERRGVCFNNFGCHFELLA